MKLVLQLLGLFGVYCMMEQAVAKDVNRSPAVEEVTIFICKTKKSDLYRYNYGYNCKQNDGTYIDTVMIPINANAQIVLDSSKN